MKSDPSKDVHESSLYGKPFSVPVPGISECCSAVRQCGIIPLPDWNSLPEVVEVFMDAVAFISDCLAQVHLRLMATCEGLNSEQLLWRPRPTISGSSSGTLPETKTPASPTPASWLKTFGPTKAGTRSSTSRSQPPTLNALISPWPAPSAI